MSSNSSTPASPPLTWLNYFDGKFLRATDFVVEQRAFWELVAHSNLADGFGLVWGYDTDFCGNELRVGAGLAIDATGRVLLLPCAVAVPIDELIERSRSVPESTGQAPNSSSGASAEFADCVEVEVEVPHLTPEGEQLWLITVAHAELECGTENVYGQLCASACDIEVERPYLLETVVLRARPLELDEPYPSSNAVSLDARHLRSRVASAYFARERRTPPSRISGAGLADALWCRGAELADGEVALGVLCRRGRANLWFDAWTARRERIDEPPRGYWDHRTALRPDREFLAQILQFQCQLAELLESAPPLPSPCPDERDALVEAGATLDRLVRAWARVGDEERKELGAASLLRLEQLRQAIAKASGAPRRALARGARILIDGGIVELPPAGYLPVDPDSELSVNVQIRRLLGEGVDPVFCVIRPDDAAMHVLGAQHDDRISLLHGLDHPDDLVGIDILVPDGEFVVEEPETTSLGFRVRVGLGSEPPDVADPSKLLEALRDQAAAWVRGAGRATLRDQIRFGLAAEGEFEDKSIALWLDLQTEADPFGVEIGAATALQVEMRYAPEGSYQIAGKLTVLDRQVEQFGTVLQAQFLGTQSHESGGGVANYQVVGLARREGTSQVVGFEWYPVESDAPGFKILVIYDRDSFEIDAAWIRSVGRNLQIYQVHEHQRDEAVGDPGDPDHQAALAALERIASELDDPSFASEGAAALFPELAPSKPELEIRAKHDWVVFHARHRRECAPPIPVEGVEPNRVYRIYAVEANTIALAQEYRGALFEGRLGKLEIEEVGDIEFAPGLAKLEISEAALEALWRPHGEDRLLAWTGIAFAGAPAAEGGAIAEGRALAVERAIDDISPLVDGKPRVTVRAGIPPALAAAGIDGVIVLLTVPGPVCHSVYWLRPGLEIEQYQAMIEGQEWGVLLGSETGEPLAFHLADLSFADDALAPEQAKLLKDAADLQMGAAAIFGRPIDRVFTTLVEGSGHPTSTAGAHRTALLDALDSHRGVPASVTEVEGNPRACDLASFVLPAARRYSIYFVSERSYVDQLSWGSSTRADLIERLTEIKAQLLAEITVLVTQGVHVVDTQQHVTLDEDTQLYHICYAFGQYFSDIVLLYEQVPAVVASTCHGQSVSMIPRWLSSGWPIDETRYRDVVVLVFGNGNYY